MSRRMSRHVDHGVQAAERLDLLRPRRSVPTARRRGMTTVGGRSPWGSALRDGILQGPHSLISAATTRPPSSKIAHGPCPMPNHAVIGPTGRCIAEGMS